MKQSIVVLAIFAAVFFYSKPAQAQPPGWSWAKSAGGAAADAAVSMAGDATGNIIVAGYFNSDSIGFGNYLVNSGGADIFITKYDFAGNVLWAKSAGGLLDDMPFDIASDSAGNLFVTGVFYSDSITFDGITLYNSGAVTCDIFIVKYDGAGNVVWARRAGGTDIDEGRSIDVDPGGNIYVTGGYRSASADFGTFNMTLNGTGDVFLAKYDPAGTALWVKGSAGANYQEGLGVAASASGNVYITGMFYSSTLSFDANSLTNNGSSDMFVVAYDSAGNVVWAKNCGGTDYEEGMSIAAHNNGDIYVGGLFRSASAVFQSVTLSNAGAAGSNDVYLAKFSAAGIVQWAKSAGGPGSDETSAIAIDNQRIVITGGFSGPTASFGANTISNAGLHDIFVASYDVAGTAQWAVQAGSTRSDMGQDILIDPNQHICHTGYFESDSVAFGNKIVNNNDTTADIFVAKIPFLPIGFEQIEREAALISITPNPFSDHTLISISKQENNNIFYFEVAEITGRVICRQVFENKQVLFNRNQLTSGTYIYNVSDKNKRIGSGKLLIK